MNLDIKNKVIFVTGSSKGIGFGIATTLMNEGCNVIINGRDDEYLKYKENSIKKIFSDNILAISGDLNNQKVVEEVKNKSIEKWGRLDGVVANAGSVKDVHKWNIKEEDWDWYFSNNFNVAYKAIQPLVSLLEENRGSIVTIGSIAGVEDVGAPMPYIASKMALLVYTKSLSRRLAKKNIRVNMVSPGNIIFPGGNWDKKQKTNPNEIKKMLERNVPLGTFGTPEDIGNIVAFLVSKRASFITGANFVVDGGQTSNLVL